MAAIHTVEMQVQFVGYDFKQKVQKNITEENSKVSNDYFWKSNEYTDKNIFGRTLDLTAFINKPDGYLKGKLSDSEDTDYYRFNITEYRALGLASDKYNLDIAITLDHVPEGCEYEMVLYDEEGNQVGFGKDNGNGGKSLTIPNWNAENKGYTVKVQAKDGSAVNPEENYHLSRQHGQIKATVHIRKCQRFSNILGLCVSRYRKDWQIQRKCVQLRKSGQNIEPIIQSRWRNCTQSRQRKCCRERLFLIRSKSMSC